MPCFPTLSCTVLDSNNAFKSSVANMKVKALSDTMSFGKDFLLVNCLKACKKTSSDRLVTTARCIVLVLVHVYKHIYYRPCLLLDGFKYTVPQ